jgi:hypothetical protein
MNDWSATASVFRRIVTSTYDPGQELGPGDAGAVR